MSLTLPAGVISPGYEAPAVGGILQDDFRLPPVANLAGRTAQGPNGGWTWGHRGVTPGALNTQDTGLFTAAGISEEYFVDAGQANHFAEITLRVDNFVRSGGTYLRGGPGLGLLCEHRFSYQCRVYVIDNGARTTNGFISPAPSISNGDTLRCAIDGSIITMRVNGVIAGTLDIAPWYSSFPGLETNTEIGLYAEDYTASGARAFTFRGGAGDGE